MVVTLAIVLGLGVLSARRVKTAEGFSLAGRSAGLGLMSGSLAGTIIGGAATVGTAQLAFRIGLSAWWFTLGSGLAFVLLALFYARPLRDSSLETVSQFLVIHYGPMAGPLTAIVSSLGILFSAIASALAGIHLVGLIFGIPAPAAAALLAAMVLAYVLFGGMTGAGVAGLMKLAILWLSLMIAGIGAAVTLANTPNLHELFPATPWFSLMGDNTVNTLGNVFSLIVGVICTQSYIQAIYSASDSRTAARGTMLAAALIIPVGLPSVAVGMAMHAQHPDLSPILALPYYFITEMPGWLGGIGLAGIMLSVIGSIAGLSLGIGTMMANDIGRAVLGIYDNRKVLWCNRAVVLAVTVFSLLVALANPDSLVLDWNYLSMALRGSGMFLPLSLAIFWPRHLGARAAVTAMALSTVVAVVGRTVFHLPVNPLYLGLATAAMLIILGVVHTSHRQQAG